MTEQINFDSSRRRFPRVHLKAFAEVVSEAKHDVRKEFNAVCINISEGGCCLEVGTLLSGPDLDYGLRVGIDLPDREPRLINVGKIAWLEEENENILDKYLVGVEFRDLSQQDKDRIRKFVQSQIETKT